MPPALLDAMISKITGKNVDLGENLRGYALNRLKTALEKYAGRSICEHVSVEKNHYGFLTQCSIHLASGLDIQSTGTGNDAYASVDSAIERLEKRLRRYKRRLKSHGQGIEIPAPMEAPAEADAHDLIDADDQDGGAKIAEGDTGAPAVIAEMPARIRTMSVSDAVMQMDLAEKSLLVFRNAAHGGLNVIYRRSDGNIGWIDPNGVAGAEA